MTLDIQQVGQIALNVKDVERATAFYRDTLGLRHLFSAPPKMSFFELGGVRLLLGEPEKPDDAHGSALLYYRVTDINAAHAKLAAKSVHVVASPHFVAMMPDHELWIGFYGDGEGNTFGLMSEMPFRQPSDRCS